MKKTIIAIAGAAIAGALGFAAPALADTPAPCSYFGDNPWTEGYNGICGVPDLNDSILNAGTNLQNNFSPSQAAQNVQDNFNPSTAGGNLEHAVTNGVGSDDPPA